MCANVDRKARWEAGEAVVVNLKTDAKAISWAKRHDRFVYVGRGSRWGNPFRIGHDGDRAAVVAKYTNWIVNQPQFGDVASLHGKFLACYCCPELCHAEVLAAFAKQATDPVLASIEAAEV